ncbi:MAG: helix-turn-helix domain-containing protein [Microbacteriaceae bacterium]|jgi:transcriptional regulator with XRE-family HTH domain|uniref:helix-turn-helix domain-containing protein n=1 Tax=unclassified Microbacterium TaxID=2609290 RepID=UPI0024B74DD5|nr:MULTISPECIES: helix-turn-helix transcriptional regulator [unclassified Microbacterium]MBT9608284.1 helix-turn-helix domain-containing protein [Microbacterium sp.]MCC6854747.1 helix-turn-helix domain-containing protein [Microbacteriaceae bacterium]MDI9889563.1 helix-turn-helix transcriptional regulator [Microbacterium sp. IEGM 1404]
MDARAEASDFLKSRRARLTPDAVGLSPAATGRRVKGLRREEVATLAGVSAEYYNRMERGMLDGVSEPVLHAIARALRLDEAELTHLFDLARSVSATATPSAARRPSRPRTRQITQRLLDGMTEIPAYARNDRYDILAMNRLGAALLPGLKTDHPNLARYIFLDPHAQTFYAAWEQVARDTVAALRIEAGRNPFDRGLTDLIGELSTRSDAFRTWWASHNVRLHTSATKTFHHPEVGDVEVTGEALNLASEPGTTIIAYTVEPASRSAENLQLLANWMNAAETPRTQQS